MGKSLSGRDQQESQTLLSASLFGSYLSLQPVFLTSLHTQGPMLGCSHHF
jgi:hypothetical protein